MTDIIVPQLGVTVSEVTIVEWLAGEGETVTEGQPLVLVATDKTEVEIESPGSGTLARSAQPEETHPVSAVIGRIEA